MLMGDKLRTFQDAVKMCAVREAIFRNNKPSLKYCKNHSLTLEDRVPLEDQLESDWRIYDPRDDDDCSLFMFND